MERLKERLIGSWRQLPGSSCADSYPDQLEFRKEGIYLVPQRTDVFWNWQSGDYEVVAQGRIKIQTSNDAMVTYRFSLSDGKNLTFRDQMGCEFSYRREN